MIRVQRGTARRIVEAAGRQQVSGFGTSVRVVKKVISSRVLLAAERQNLTEPRYLGSGTSPVSAKTRSSSADRLADLWAATLQRREQNPGLRRRRSR